MLLIHFLYVFCTVIPQKLLQPGVVIAGGSKCKYTKKIVDWMTAERRQFKIEYIDKDKELTNYIVDVHKGGIPIVFENGIYQGSGKEYMNKIKALESRQQINSLLHT